ncbi:hypothetical protein ACIQU6_17285 [Streptomyces sp. NPDC090442]|uniref:hypothetical protein n=1 Tax=Streptomyces sp. NPDC090442 TaxID=3365962 RepID=UPI00380BE8E2
MPGTGGTLGKITIGKNTTINLELDSTGRHEVGTAEKVDVGELATWLAGTSGLPAPPALGNFTIQSLIVDVYTAPGATARTYSLDLIVAFDVDATKADLTLHVGFTTGNKSSNTSTALQLGATLRLQLETPQGPEEMAFTGTIEKSSTGWRLAAAWETSVEG